jgi:hypothetical protein
VSADADVEIQPESVLYLFAGVLTTTGPYLSIHIKDGGTTVYHMKTMEAARFAVAVARALGVEDVRDWLDVE